MNKSNFINSKVYRVWSGLADGLIVNLLFLVTCIPIITYGTAKTALYETAVKWVKGDGASGREYWNSFKANLKVSILPGIVVLVIGAVVLLDYNITEPGSLPRIITYILIVFFYMFKEQLFLVNARLSCSFGQLMRNGLLMVIKSPAQTLAGALLWMVPAIVLFYDFVWFARVAVIWIFAYFAFSAWAMARLTNKTYMEMFKTITLSEDNRADFVDDTNDTAAGSAGERAIDGTTDSSENTEPRADA